MYIVLNIQNGSTVSALTYDNINSAYAKYHTELAYRAEGVISTTCMIIDSTGHYLVRETYHAEPQDE